MLEEDLNFAGYSTVVICVVLKFSKDHHASGFRDCLTMYV